MGSGVAGLHLKSALIHELFPVSSIQLTLGRVCFWTKDQDHLVCLLNHSIGWDCPGYLGQCSIHCTQI